MDTSHLQPWPRDFQTELPLVPPGEFVDFSRYEAVSKALAHVRKLAVPRGMFDSTLFEFTTDLPVHVGWGSVQLGQSRALTFRVQVGSPVLY